MNISQMQQEIAASKTALAAILHESKKIGVDLEQLRTNISNGLLDSSKPYRWANPDVATHALEIIDSAIQDIK